MLLTVYEEILTKGMFFFLLQDECQNYIRVLAKEGEGQFLVCGTNAYKPLCRLYAQQVRIIRLLYIPVLRVS